MASSGVAKAVLIWMGRSPVIEVATKRIIVNNLLPGWIATGTQTPEQAIVLSRTLLMKRAGTPGIMADLMVFLASAEATCINDQEFIEDGGNFLQEYKVPSGFFY